jgi:excisionase family DNA binding protein
VHASFMSDAGSPPFGLNGWLSSCHVSPTSDGSLHDRFQRRKTSQSRNQEQFRLGRLNQNSGRITLGPPMPHLEVPPKRGRMSTEVGPKVLNLAEAAEFVRCSRSHLCNILNGKVRGVPRLPSVRIGRRVLFRREALEQWLYDAESTAAKRAAS